jgi:serum/glucocorticoid-regulated kinase 2
LSSKSVKRKIPIKKVFGITIGVIGTEFVVHVPEEYDYRYSSPERRDQAVLSILYALKGSTLPIFFKDEIALTAFTTTKVH